MMQMVPPKIESREAEKEALLEAAKFMLVAARTAPKTAGIDDVLAIIVHGKEKDTIAEKMEAISAKRKIAKNVRDSEMVILIGVRGSKSIGLSCGACGYRSCEEFDGAKKNFGRDFIGSTCVFKALDLGIALGSAAKTASILNVDNRVMYRVGTAAMKLKLLPEATVVVGIPVSAKGKSIYFDRK